MIIVSILLLKTIYFIIFPTFQLQPFTNAVNSHYNEYQYNKKFCFYESHESPHLKSNKTMLN